MENMWYRIDDLVVKSVTLFDVLNGTDLTVLIYEQIEPVETASQPVLYRNSVVNLS